MKNETVLRNKLKPYLTPAQLDAYIKCQQIAHIYIINKQRTPENKKAYDKAYKAFLNLTGGKPPCALIPSTVWWGNS